MNLYITKKLTEKLKTTLETPPPADELYTWRANYVQGHGQRFVVFMNDASRFTIVINEAKVAKLKKLPELFIQVLQDTMLALSISPEVVEHYISELGEIKYAKNSCRKGTARLNKCADAVWYALRDLTDDVELSVQANNYMHSAPDGSDENYSTPKENMIKALDVYGLPVRKCRAFDLNIRLQLEGNDAIRKVRVPANISFEKLHKVIQTLFDWKNYHLYSFGMFKEWSENYYAAPDVKLIMFEDCFDSNPNAVMITGKKLSDYVPEFSKILYTYDFGDNWHHYIDVENVIDDCSDALPVLLSGEGDAPPEDVGGPWGYANFLEVIANPENEEYEHMMAWSKSQWWKPFDLERTARMIYRQ